MKRQSHAFTLIELLVVIGIITLLVALLLPALSRARTQARIVSAMAYMADQDRDPTCFAHYKFARLESNAGQKLVNSAIGDPLKYGRNSNPKRLDGQCGGDNTVEALFDPVWVQGRWAGKGALYFQGNNALGSPFVDLGKGTAWDNLIVDRFTIAAWYLNTKAQSGCVVDRSFNAAHGSPFYSWLIYANFGNESHVRCGNSTSLAGSVSTPINVWHLVVVTFDGANMRHYVDGALMNTVALSGSNTKIQSSTQTPRIGARNTPLAAGCHPVYGVGQENFAGYIDDVAFYNRALGDDEVRRMFAVGNVSTPGAGKQVFGNYGW